MTIQEALLQAQQAAREGQHDAARALLVKILQEQPDCISAWLWLSGVIPDLARRRECLEKVLTLDPHNAAATQGLQALSLQAVADDPAPPEPPPPPAPAATRRLGEYLVSQRFITQQQLDAALREQQDEARYGHVTPLGDILLRRRWLTMFALTRMLELQRTDRVRAGSAQIDRLGEYLVSQRIISDRQLSEVISRQADLKRQGQSFQLGELLVRSGMLSRQQLQQAIDAHQQQFVRQISS